MSKNTFLMIFLFLSSCTNKEKKVEVIHLSELKLTQIPDSVFTHPELKELYLGPEGFILYPPLSGLKSQIRTGISNNLTELDNRISKLKNLKVLNLVANQLRELPASITELKNLEDLDLKNS
jgi:Leucine-rich repeat (LRR) protein